MPDAVTVSPKTAALLAVARESLPQVPLIRLDSRGVVLVYGRDAAAVHAAALLEDLLDVTVLIKPPAALTLLPTTEFPVAKGAIRAAKGYLGTFELTVDDFALPGSPRADTLVFGAARDGAVSHCDIVLDMSGGAPLFAASSLRDGYLRADPGSPNAVAAAVSQARELVGSFDKPQYVRFHEHLCAHSRSRIVGCRRCLDLCPAGAITPTGDHVAVDPYICAGCGQCTAACPTGAATYTVPPSDALMRQLRALLMTYRDAGGKQPVVLVHDRAHGQPLLDALVEWEGEVPENVLPFCVNEVTQMGLESFVALFAYGASAARVLMSAKPRHETLGLSRTLELTDAILGALGLEGNRLSRIETDDPEALQAALAGISPLAPVPSPSTFLPSGDQRSVLRFALRELQRVAPSRPEIVPLPTGAPLLADPHAVGNFRDDRATHRAVRAQVLAAGNLDAGRGRSTCRRPSNAARGQQTQASEAAGYQAGTLQEQPAIQASVRLDLRRRHLGRSRYRIELPIGSPDEHGAYFAG